MGDSAALELAIAGEEQTLALGRLLGELVRPGDLIGLHGPLGAGKTVFVRGLAEGLGADPERVRSPSFTLLVTYEGGRLRLHHLDLFRLQPSEEDRLALREFLFGADVAAVEWFEHLGEDADRLTVEIRPTATSGASDERRIRLTACGDHYRPLVQAVRSRWP
jgi:tRNA threonylcarbamoyladenosine biosynthesis protein TsaE